jgi:glycosyltransferase involved in cell wall biosynthesis
MPTLVAHTIDYPPNRYIGAELATHRTLAYLAEHGWTCIARPARSGKAWMPYELDGVLVTPAPITSLPRPDIVMHHNTDVAIATTHAQMHKVPRVMTLHGGWAGWLRDRVRASTPDLVVANSESMARPLAADGQPVTVLHPPCWPPKNPGSAASDRYVTLINLTQSKGVETFYELARRYPSIQFLGVQGGYGEQLAPPVGLLGRNLQILPHGTNMSWIWDMTSVLLMPSTDESWGMVAVEAMQRGIPVIGSAIPGLMECLGDTMPTVPLYGPAGESTIGMWAYTLLDVYGGRWQTWSQRATARGLELDPGQQLVALDGRLREMIT